MHTASSEPSGLRPQPIDPVDRRRWEETSRRLRMQRGQHREDVLRRMGEFFAKEVIERIHSGTDLSSNAAATANAKKAIQYDVTPSVSAQAEQADIARMDLDRFWALSQDRHLTCNAANEVYVRFDWDRERFAVDGTGITAQTVDPDCIVARAHPSRPDVPVYVEWLHTVYRGTGDDCRCVWVWEIWDVSRPDVPVFMVLSADRKENLTAELWPDLYGPDAPMLAYPYWDRQQRPILPFVAYHRAVKNVLWDPFSRMEIYDGTLTAACLRTWFVCGVRDLAHPQRVGVDVDLPAASNDRSKPGADRVTLDASAILMFRSIGTNPSLSTLEPAMDPVEALDAIERYNASLLEGDGLGIEPSNTSRMSGYAIVVTRDSLRRVQRQQTPACRIGDQQSLSLMARLLNSYQGTNLPEDPHAWGISYHGVERSLEEIRSALEQVQILRGAKLITRKDALIRVEPQLTPVEAERKLAEIDAEEAPAEGAHADVPSEAVDLLNEAGDQLVELADPGTPVDPERLTAIIAAIGRAVGLLERAQGGGQAAPAPDSPDTLTDPSTGAPMRTPRGVSATNADT